MILTRNMGAIIKISHHPTFCNVTLHTTIAHHLNFGIVTAACYCNFVLVIVISDLLDECELLQIRD